MVKCGDGLQNVWLRLLMLGHSLVLLGQEFSDKTSRHEFCFKAWPEPTLNNLKYTFVGLFFFNIVLIGGVINTAFNFMSE